MEDSSIKCLAPGRQKLRQLAGRAPQGQGEVLPLCVCVSACQIPPSLSTLSLTQPESTKEGLKPLPLTLQATRVLFSSVWQANMDSSLPCRSELCRAGHAPPLLCLSTYGGLTPSLLCSHDTSLHCHSAVFTQMYIYLVSNRAKEDPPVSWPLGSHWERHLGWLTLLFEVIHL